MKHILSKALSESKVDKLFKKVKRRKEIIKTAAQLFSQKSYHDVTMEEVASTLGVAKGTLYLYFESKEKLYLSILENGFEAIQTLIAEVQSGRDPAPLKLKKILKLIFRFYRQNIDILRILTRDETHLIREHYEFTEFWKNRGVQVYERILERGVKEGSLRPINTRLTAIIIFGLIRSVLFHYDSEKSAEEIAEGVFSIIEKGILAPPGELHYSHKNQRDYSKFQQKSIKKGGKGQ